VSVDRRTRWGWHQLTDRWARRIVGDACVEPGDLVLDVGAGTGALTAHLVAAGAYVIAVELHPERARTLRERFAGAPVTVVQADARDLRLPRRPFQVVANPPFSTTTALLKRIVAGGSALTRADLVVPRHVARRWTAVDAPGAQRWGRFFEARVGRALSPHAFRPIATQPVHCLQIRLRAPVRAGDAPKKRFN
jgi:23S rRNA (adenine-N6)-dimethyltransferase